MKTPKKRLKQTLDRVEMIFEIVYGDYVEATRDSRTTTEPMAKRLRAVASATHTAVGAISQAMEALEKALANEEN